MKAVIKLDVPDWQIGEDVSVYFPDTMCKRGVCEKDELIRCGECHNFVKMAETYGNCELRIALMHETDFCSYAVRSE